MLVTDENKDRILDWYDAEKPEYLAVDTETTGLRWERDRLFLIIIAWGDERSFVFPEDTWDVAAQLLQTDVPKAFHNASFDLHFLEKAGFKIRGKIIDTLILAQATGSFGKDRGDSKNNKQLKTLGDKFCSDIDAITPKKKLDKWFRDNGIKKEDRDYSKVPMEIMEPYARMDGIITHRLVPILSGMIEKFGTQRPRDIDYATLPVIYRMENLGIRIDRDRAKVMVDDYREREEKAYQELIEISGWEFNPNSDAELKDILTKLGYKPGDRVDEDALDALGKGEPFIEAVKNFRDVSKTLHTYLEPIYEFSSYDGRLHGNFNITGAYTGRLSSSNPNLQNIPPWVRCLFLPDEGCELWFFDYSQMEMRMAADYSRDPVMLSAYIGDHPIDLHAETAKAMKPGLTEDSPDFPKWRSIGKTTNFAMLYGAGGNRIGQITGTNRDEGLKFKRRINGRYEIFAAWFKKVQKVFKQRGYILNRFGRRYENVPGFEYRGVNYLIQGTCADMMKIALQRIDQEIYEKGLLSRLLLTIHDEIVLNVHPEEQDIIRELVPRCMTEWPELELRVPMEVELKRSATNWGEKG